MPYRPCVGVMLINREGLVWTGERVKNPNAETMAFRWQMPQGGIDEGESPVEAAYRELWEETGTRRADIIGESRNWLTYELPDDLLGKALKGKYRGQKQKWFAMRFTGTDDDFDLDVHHREFSRWAWRPPGSIPELIVPFKRPVYEEVVREFAPLAVPQEGEEKEA